MGAETDKVVRIDFNIFISGLMAEGMMALGLIKNPVTNEVKKDLIHANMVIETLAMLKEKTKGNLVKEEEDGLEEVLHHLRMGYVAILKAEEKR